MRLVQSVSVFFLLFNLTFANNTRWEEEVNQITAMPGGPLTSSQVEVLHLGKTALPKRLELIAQAQNSIVLMTTYFQDDEEGNRIADALIARKAQVKDLEIRVLIDYGATAWTEGNFTSNIKAKLEKAAGEDNVRTWNSIGDLNLFSKVPWKNRLHSKLFIVDGQHLIMGGLNIADEYLQGGITAKGWHDTDMYFEGESARRASRYAVLLWNLTRRLDKKAPWSLFPIFGKKNIIIPLFERGMLRNSDGTGQEPDSVRWNYYGVNDRDLEKYDGFPFNYSVNLHGELRDSRFNPVLLSVPDGHSKTWFWSDNPMIEKVTKTNRILEVLLPNAKKRVRIYAPYPSFGPMFRDLILAAAKNVEVELITNSLATNDVGAQSFYSGTRDLLAMAQAGVKVYQWLGHQALIHLEKNYGCKIPQWPGHTIHTKALIIDDEWVVTGSSNLNVRSEKENIESMVLVQDAEVVAKWNAIFDADLLPGQATVLSCAGEKNYFSPEKVEALTVEKLTSIFNKNRKEIEKQEGKKKFR